MNLKEWAVREGVSYATARRWLAAGKLPVPARKVGGLILVEDRAASAPEGITAVYARVSSADQKPDLDRQVARVTAWASGEGLPVGRVVTEVGSALNGKRRKFLALLRDEKVTTIVTEHRDRFARFGVAIQQASEGIPAARVPDLPSFAPSAASADPGGGCRERRSAPNYAIELTIAASIT